MIEVLAVNWRDHMAFLLLVIGLALLVFGADHMVAAAAKLAHSFGISKLIIGLSVVAFGTSAPEAAIGIISGIDRTNTLTLGDVIGSSIANIALIVGVSAIIYPIKTQSTTLTREIPISLAVQFVFSVFLISGSGISRVEAFSLLLAFAVFVFYLAHSTRIAHQLFRDTLEETAVAEFNAESEPNKLVKARWKNSLLSLFGLIMVLTGANLVVRSATTIADSFGVSEAVIGVTIVALGTSLPELAISVLSAIRKEHELLVGNIIGSNIFNVLLVIGLSGAIYPMLL
jgi:cation:H+ antiporter